MSQNSILKQDISDIRNHFGFSEYYVELDVIADEAGEVAITFGGETKNVSYVKGEN